MVFKGVFMLRVAFQGVRGANSEEAVEKLVNEEIEFVPSYSFDDVFDVVETGKADRGVIPIENSLTGSIHRNYDLLLRNNLWIMGETKIRIVHNLIVNKGVKFEDIKRIYSHPQGLSQCEKFLNKYSQIEKSPAFDTAGSVKMIKEQKMFDAGAVASRKSAIYYDMVILEEGIEDIDENYTRFLMLLKSKEVPKSANKTSIVFSTENIPGILFKSLSVFALRDINLSKIESRPVLGKPWEYFFYLDIEENLNNERCINAINHLKEIASYLKILGCYPKG
jgi:prephenate dehydratase